MRALEFILILSPHPSNTPQSSLIHVQISFVGRRVRYLISKFIKKQEGAVVNACIKLCSDWQTFAMRDAIPTRHERIDHRLSHCLVWKFIQSEHIKYLS